MKKVTTIFLLFLFFFAGTNLIFSQVPAPVNLKATAVKTMMGQGVQLNWEYPYKELVKFSVYRREGSISDTGSFRKIEKTSLLPIWVDANVINGKTYTYYVVAVGSDSKESQPSNKTDIKLVSTEPAKGNITGTLISDISNKPIMKGKIQFFPNYPTFAPYLITSITDSLGRFSAKLIPGPYYIYASAEKYIGEYYENAKEIKDAKIVTVTDSGKVDISISLAPYTPPVIYTLKGNVKNSQGKAISTMIQVFRLNTVLPDKEKCNLISVKTDINGNYSVNLRSNDTVVVFAAPVSIEYLPQYYKEKKTLQEADRLIITSSLSDINFILESKPALKNSVSGQVKDTLSQGVTSSVVAYRVSDGKLNGLKIGTLTDSTGAYTISNLNPGKYIMMAIPKPGYLPTYFRYDGKTVYERRDADTIYITETSVLNNINFIVKKVTKPKGFGSIAGFIKDNKGNGINGALSFVVDEKGAFVSYAMSDANGEYCVDGLTSGNYLLQADMFEYQETKPELVNLLFENVTPVVNFTMAPSSITSVNEKNTVLVEYLLKQNYPNPFNPSTTISFTIPQNGLVTLKVYNILGKEVATLINEIKPAGSYSVKFNASNIPSGIYFYTLTSGKFSETKKLVLLK